MSRIEKAMEKARELAARQISPASSIPENSVPHGAPPEQDQPAVGTTVPDTPVSSPDAPNESPSMIIDISSPRLVTVSDSNVPIAEEYRKLKSTIVQFVNRDPSKNLFLISSSVGGEGKSMTALNLSISLAQEHDKKVLLIDADLRKPSIAKYLGITPDSGLSEYLKKSHNIDDIIIEVGLGGLYCLPGGRSVENPVELYSSQKMKDLLTELKERFSDGYVIIDSSPVLPFAEARILATYVDSVIYIIREGSTSLQNIEEGLNSLYGAEVVGLVYNQATSASLAGGYHYYYYNYDYKRRYGYGYGYGHGYGYGYGRTPDSKPEKKEGLLSRFKKQKPTS